MRAWLTALSIAALACWVIPACTPTETDDLTGTTGSTTDTTGTTTGTTDSTSGTTDTGSDTTGSTGGDATDATDTSGTDTGSLLLTGQISSADSAKTTPRSEDAEGGSQYAVVAQSMDTLEVYRAETDESGLFELEIPEEESGSQFIVTVITPDGKPGGPVVFDQDEGTGYTGLAVDHDIDLGSMEVPQNPDAGPIEPGTDSTLDPNDYATGIVARLDENGVPVGVPTWGRGEDAQGSAVEDPAQAGDRDQDGLIDMFDADDDGDGTIDDFDDEPVADVVHDGVIVNFFMNLKIDDVQAGAYFSGNVVGIEESLKNDTVITFEVIGDASLGKTITGARIIGPPAPAPPYLPISEVLGTGTTPTLWSAAGYALRPDGTNHFQEWVVPKDFMNTGDTFTVEITFDDSTVAVYSRMINYVFKSIPKLINYGPPSALTTYVGPGEVPFDGTQDLVLEWAPPVDDFGMLLVGLPYQFEVFYYDGSNQQINDIDPLTWATPITGWDASRQVYEVSGTTLSTLSAGNTFSVQLPKELFPDTVQTSFGTETVASYKVDIAAQNNGNNAALMLPLSKS